MEIELQLNRSELVENFVEYESVLLCCCHEEILRIGCAVQGQLSMHFTSAIF